MAFQTFDAAEMTSAPHSARLSRRSLFRGGALLTGAAALSGLPFGRELLAHDVAEAWPNVAKLARKFVGEKKVANLFMTFGWRQEDHAHTVGGGTLAMDSDVPVDENTLYRIYSMTKPITGMATMMLIDEGKLGLDMPLYDVLPAFKDMQVLVDPKGPLDKTEPAIRPITIRQLLTHTAGLGYQIISEGPLRQAFNEKGIISGRASRLPIPGFSGATPPSSLEAWANNLATLPLAYQPATIWSYSCGLDLLGRVIEVASGMSYPQFIQTRLLDPLGMNSTYFSVPQSELGRFTTNYGVLNGAAIPIDGGPTSVFAEMPTAPMGGADLVSTPRDYDRFLRMLLGYGKLGKERVMSELAVRVGVSNLIPKTVSTKGTWAEGEGHGAGGRSVGESFGWGGAAGTLGAVDFGLNLRTALWTQYMPSDAYPIRAEYLSALEADIKAMKGA